MGILLNLTKEYFDAIKREEDYTPKERISRGIDNLIDKWVEENNVQFIDTGKTYGGKDEEQRKIEIANMDFLAKSDEDSDIDYSPLKELVEYGYDNNAFWRSRPFLGNEDVQRCLEMFEMSKKYQLIRIGWLDDALKKLKKDIKCVVDDDKKKIIQCEIFDVPIKILAALKHLDNYHSISYYGNDYTVNTGMNIRLDDYHFKPEDNHFDFYRTSDSYGLESSTRFRLCKRYSDKRY
jgi:hypothetical protein